MESQKDLITFSATQLLNVGVWVGTLTSLVLNPKLLTITYPAPGVTLGSSISCAAVATCKLPVHIFIPPIFVSMIRHFCWKRPLSKASYYWISTLFKLFVHYSSSSRFSSSIHSFPIHMYILWRTPCKATLSKIWSLLLEDEEAITYLAQPRWCQHLGCGITLQGPGSGGGGAAPWAEAWRRVGISRIKTQGVVTKHCRQREQYIWSFNEQNDK